MPFDGTDWSKIEIDLRPKPFSKYDRVGHALVKARRYIEYGWSKGGHSADWQTGQHYLCVLGAIGKATNTFSWQKGYRRLWHYNDNHNTKKQDMLDLIDRTIADPDRRRFVLHRYFGCATALTENLPHRSR